MALDKNIIKLGAIVIVGGVAKALLAEPNTYVTNEIVEGKVVDTRVETD